MLQNASAAPVTLSVGNGVFGGNLSGPGGLTHTGGLLMLTAPQSYGGPTIVTGGVLQINNPTISGFGNGAGWTFSTSAASNSTAGQRGVNGDTATTTSNNTGSTATTMWYDTPLPLGGTTPWTATFSFTDLFGNGADGTCFVLQNAGNTVFSSTATGGYQGLAGILLPTSSGSNWGVLTSSPSAVALAMKIYGASDIGLIENPVWNTNADNAAIYSTTAAGVNLRATATPTDVTVSYNGNGTLTLSLLQGSSGTSYSMSVPLGSIFASSGGSAYVGFTSGDGGTASGQVISNFSLTMGQPAGASNLLPTGSQLNLSGGSFDLNGGSQAVGSLTGNGEVINSATAPTAALTVGNDGTNQTFSGTIQGNLALTKTGGGTLTLSGTNTYSGGTCIDGGTLIVAADDALLDGSSLMVGAEAATIFAPLQAASSEFAADALRGCPAPLRDAGQSGAGTFDPCLVDRGLRGHSLLLARRNERGGRENALGRLPANHLPGAVAEKADEMVFLVPVETIDRPVQTLLRARVSTRRQRVVDAAGPAFFLEGIEDRLLAR